jgi:hypothetical protein
MPSGYTVSGRGDLDALFALRVNAKRADVGYQVSGSDISNRYEPIGAGTPITATGYKTGGSDLASLFRSISQPIGWALVSGVTATTPPYSQVGFRSAAFGSPYGSLTPAVLNSRAIRGIYDFYEFSNGTGGKFWIVIESGAALTQNFFTSVAFVEAGITKTSAGALFLPNAPFYIWEWSGRLGLVNGAASTVVFS